MPKLFLAAAFIVVAAGTPITNEEILKNCFSSQLEISGPCLTEAFQKHRTSFEYQLAFQSWGPLSNQWNRTFADSAEEPDEARFMRRALKELVRNPFVGVRDPHSLARWAHHVCTYKIDDRAFREDGDCQWPILLYIAQKFPAQIAYKFTFKPKGFFKNVETRYIDANCLIQFQQGQICKALRGVTFDRFFIRDMILAIASNDDTTGRTQK